MNAKFQHPVLKLIIHTSLHKIKASAANHKITQARPFHKLSLCSSDEQAYFTLASNLVPNFSYRT